jgi:hypothetical protein
MSNGVPQTLCEPLCCTQAFLGEIVLEDMNENSVLLSSRIHVVIFSFMVDRLWIQ